MSVIGIISDTHDRVSKIEQAVTMFNSKGVEIVLHCGDFVAPFSILPFQKLNAPFHAVFGNNDGEKQGLEKQFKENRWVLNQRPWFFSYKDKRIAMLHEPALLHSGMNLKDFDFIFYGHTHKAKIEKKNGTLIVNPGEACGWVTGNATLAIVNLESGEGEILDITSEKV